jgi:hypothetical protein
LEGGREDDHGGTDEVSHGGCDERGGRGPGPDGRRSGKGPSDMIPAAATQCAGRPKRFFEGDFSVGKIAGVKGERTLMRVLLLEGRRAKWRSPRWR